MARLNVSARSIRNPIPSVLGFLLLTLIGLMGFHQMGIQNMPDIDLPMVVVSAALPGAALAPLPPAALRPDLAALAEPVVPRIA